MGSDPTTCVHCFKHNDLESVVLFKGSSVPLKQQWGDSHLIVKNYHEIVTNSCDENRVKRFSSNFRGIVKMVRAQIYVYLFPMLLILSNSVHRDEFMGNYKFKRKVKCKVRGFLHGFYRFYGYFLLLISMLSVYSIFVINQI